MQSRFFSELCPTGPGPGSWVPHVLVNKQGRGVGPRGLQVWHGIPLIDAALLRADAAFVIGGPDERHTTGEVVVPSSHLAGLVKHLQGRPVGEGGEGQAWKGTRSAGFSL